MPLLHATRVRHFILTINQYSFLPLEGLLQGSNHPCCIEDVASSIDMNECITLSSSIFEDITLCLAKSDVVLV